MHELLYKMFVECTMDTCVIPLFSLVLELKGNEVGTGMEKKGTEAA